MIEQRLYNTLTRTSEVLQPLVPGHVSIYVCGMTVYDYCHIGHARAMITFDVIVRWLKHAGYQVTFIRNHTDVDDKIIHRSKATGETPLELSRRYIAALDEDLVRLGLILPTAQPRVSDCIDDIVGMIAALIEKGHAYPSQGDVYFSVESCPDYGQLSGRRVVDMREGDQGDAGDKKRHVADFALWKGTRPGEEGASWPSPWGPGRPGWHIECSAMALRYLGAQFDIHGGGNDLIFPHHENEIAQSECATGHKPFARYWLHNGMLTLGTEKMAKSVGNVVRIRDLLDEMPAEALRLLYLEGHYRSPLPYSAARMEEALAALDRLYQAREVIDELAAGSDADSVEALSKSFGEPVLELQAAIDNFEGRFVEAMADDFITALALAALYDLCRAANKLANNKKVRGRAAVLGRPAQRAFALAGEVLGLAGRAPAEHFSEVRQKKLRLLGKTEADVEALIAARVAARTAKDWAEADRIRDALVALGVVLMDGVQGTTWRMRVAEPA